MYNPQNYAISIERIIKAPTHSADQIEKNPLDISAIFLIEGHSL